jgi:hypothetical protein
MRRPFSLIVILAASLIVLMLGYAALVAPYSGGGWWRMGPGMMSGPAPWGGYGPGMMQGYMYGPGRGPGWNAGWRDLNLSTDNVKSNIEHWLAWQGNPRLQVGDVKEKDADTIVADIVTKDNSLVQRFVINRHNGYFRPSED